MSYNTVVMIPVFAMDELKKNSREFVARINDGLHSIETGRIHSYSVGKKKKTVYVHKATSENMPQLLLIKNNELVDMNDDCSIEGEQNQAKYLAAIQTAQALLDKAERDFLLSVAYSVYNALSANGQIVIKNESEVLNSVKNNVAIQNSNNPEYAARIAAYIMKNQRHLREGVSVCEI